MKIAICVPLLHIAAREKRWLEFARAILELTGTQQHMRGISAAQTHKSCIKIDNFQMRCISKPQTRLSCNNFLGGPDGYDALAKQPSVSFAQLGLVEPGDRLAGRRVLIPQCFRLDRVSQTVTMENFASYTKSVRDEAEKWPETTACVLVNLLTASFADSFALLQDAVTNEPVNIFRLEKQSVAARRVIISHGMDRTQAPPGPTNNAVTHELS
jgi:hypothetical protein